MPDALDCLRGLQSLMNDRYDELLAAGKRKITRHSGHDVYLVIIDEYAFFSATVGKKDQQAEFSALTRDLVARGRAAGVIVILATQRPSHQVIDPSLRDLFGYRWAFRCTTDSSSDTVLGHGWAGQGYSAGHHRPSCTRRVLAAVRDRHPPPRQDRLPHRSADPPPGGLRRTATPEGLSPCCMTSHPSSGQRPSRAV
jgi:hypothetical protein